MSGEKRRETRQKRQDTHIGGQGEKEREKRKKRKRKKEMEWERSNMQVGSDKKGYL